MVVRRPWADGLEPTELEAAQTGRLEIIDVVASYLSATTSRQEEQTAPTA